MDLKRKTETARWINSDSEVDWNSNERVVYVIKRTNTVTGKSCYITSTDDSPSVPNGTITMNIVKAAAAPSFEACNKLIEKEYTICELPVAHNKDH